MVYAVRKLTNKDPAADLPFEAKRNVVIAAMRYIGWMPKTHGEKAQHCPIQGSAAQHVIA